MIIKAAAIVSTLLITAGSAVASPIPTQAPFARPDLTSTNLLQLAKDAHDNDHGDHEHGGHHDRGGDNDG